MFLLIYLSTFYFRIRNSLFVDFFLHESHFHDLKKNNFTGFIDFDTFTLVMFSYIEENRFNLKK